jgi:hypothetical protein
VLNTHTHDWWGAKLHINRHQFTEFAKHFGLLAAGMIALAVVLVSFAWMLYLLFDQLLPWMMSALAAAAGSIVLVGLAPLAIAAVFWPLAVFPILGAFAAGDFKLKGISN